MNRLKTKIRKVRKVSFTLMKVIYPQSLILKERQLSSAWTKKKPYAEACNFTKINTPPWRFVTLFKCYKWYQIVQTISYPSIRMNTGWRLLMVLNKKQKHILLYGKGKIRLLLRCLDNWILSKRLSSCYTLIVH